MISGQVDPGPRGWLGEAAAAGGFGPEEARIKYNSKGVL